MYVEITIEQMRTFLRVGGAKYSSFIELPIEASTKEYVFEMPLLEYPQIVIKVYSSIHRDTGTSRSKGTDVIRICAVDIIKKTGWIKTVKVLRVDNWRVNLTNAIDRIRNESLSRLSKMRAQTHEGIIIKHPQQPFKIPQLREINNIIKMPMPLIWIENIKGYLTNVTTLNEFKSHRSLCPKCDTKFTRKNLISELTKSTFENLILKGTETISWEFECSNCHSILRVNNE